MVRDPITILRESCDSSVNLVGTLRGYNIQWDVQIGEGNRTEWQEANIAQDYSTL